MLKIHAEYGRDTSHAILTGISRQVSPCSADISRTALGVNQECLELKWKAEWPENSRSAWDASYDTTP
jgi:hypothetical protein